jgi:alkylhydroperoxidase family enzyme
MNDYTPGPWVVGNSDDDGRVCVQADGVALALVCARGSSAHNPHYGQREYNARLIAAAPDLLAALKNWQNFDLPLAERQNAAMAAIQKAEGRR